MKTINQIKKYEAEIDIIEVKIKRLQDRCKHKNVERTPRSNTGNWDAGADRYWYDCRCTDCDKVWWEDQ